MSTIIFILAASILGIVLMSKIPGVEHLVKPIIDLVFTFIKFMSANMLAWSVFLFKLFFNSHFDLIKHLLLSDKAIDPSIAMREDIA